MSGEAWVGGVIEPTVSVANGLLDVARRLAADLGPRVADLSWTPPDRYVAPLAVGPAAAGPVDEAPVEALRLAAREIEEFAVQMAAPTLVQEGPDFARVVTLLASKGDEIAAAVRVVADRMRESGLDVLPVDPVAFTLATVTGEAKVQAVAAAFPAPREAPLAGWLVGGLCLHAGPAPETGRAWLPTRVRYVPLRRLNARRPDTRSPL